MQRNLWITMVALLAVCSFTLRAAEEAKKATDEKKKPVTEKKKPAEAKVDKTVAKAEQQRFHVTLEALGLFRTNGAKSTALAYDDMDTIGVFTDDVKVMDVEDIQSDAELSFSPKLTFAYDLTENQAIEGSYFGFGIMNWEGQKTVVSPQAQLYAPFEGLDENFTWNFYETNSISAKYRSELNHNAEVSYRYTCVPSASGRLMAGSGLLGGLRYMNIEEEFAMTGVYTDVEASNPPLDTYRIRTGNDLLGAQVGGVLALNPHSKIRIELTGKVAFMANMIDKVDEFSGFQDQFEPLSWKNSTDTTEFALVGDLSARISGQVHKNVWLTAGYSAIYIDGVALAPEQHDWSEARTRFHQVETGSVLYHGFNAGVTIKW